MCIERWQQKASVNKYVYREMTTEANVIKYVYREMTIEVKCT